MKFNYLKTSKDLLEGLSDRTKDVIMRRFALGKSKKPETLEGIGKDLKVTRERVRQIELDGIKKIKKNIKTSNTKKAFEEIQSFFIGEIEKNGGIKREDKLLEIFGSKEEKNAILFLLNLCDKCERTKEDKNFYAFWSTSKKASKIAKDFIDEVIGKLKKLETPISLSSLDNEYKQIDKSAIASYVEISKHILETMDKKRIGLFSWPEVNPKTVRDKIFLILKENKKPLHYRDISGLISTLDMQMNSVKKNLHPQTVHNELIRNKNFVLIGRGIYALSEWGYNKGQVKDIINEVLKANGPLNREQVVKAVSDQRMVKESTILLNLQNKKLFSKDNQGNYKVREA